jgi:hypothetical protein
MYTLYIFLFINMMKTIFLPLIILYACSGDRYLKGYLRHD